MSIPLSGATRIAAVIGSPVAHSLSPALHNAVFEAADLDWRFVAFEVAPGDGAAAVTAMRTLGISGYAVTMPHKAEVAEAVDRIDPAAAALGSVNTVVLRPDGSTYGASTDGAGFVNAVAEQGYTIDDKRVLVVGAGAAARSIIDALGRSGAREIIVVNRSGPAAETAAGLATVARVGRLAEAESVDLLVNTTPIGMAQASQRSAHDNDITLDPALLRPGLAVADIVYHPLETALLRAARAVGAPTFDGLGMLVHQAMLQQQLWTGVLPDPKVMRSAAEAALAARSR